MLWDPHSFPGIGVVNSFEWNTAILAGLEVRCRPLLTIMAPEPYKYTGLPSTRIPMWMCGSEVSPVCLQLPSSRGGQ